MVDRTKLEELLREAAARPPMTQAEIRAQRISFAYGQLMDCAPHITKEEVAEEHDRIYGEPSE